MEQQQISNTPMLKLITKSSQGKSLLTKLVQQLSAFSKEDVEKSEKYVTETLRARSWVDYLTSSFYPKKVRTDYCAIQMFNLEMIRISDNLKEPSLGLGKLEFWRGTINKIYSQEQPDAQPISICLDHACHNNPLTKGYFDRIINAKAEELSTRTIETMEQLLRLCRNSYSTLIALNLELLGIEIEREHEDLITKMGHCIGICMYLKRVPYGLRNYRFFMPLDIMVKYNVQTTKIWDRIHGKPSEEFFDVVLEVAAYAKKEFEEAVRIFEGLQQSKLIHPQAFRAFLRAVEIEQYLKDLQKYNFNLFRPELIKGSPISLPLKCLKAARNHRFYNAGKID